MNYIRSSDLWIVGCTRTRAMSTYIVKCGICRCLRGNELGHNMYDLPVERLEDSPTFTLVSIDCFGPFAVKNGRKISKRYSPYCEVWADSELFIDTSNSHRMSG